MTDAGSQRPDADVPILLSSRARTEHALLDATRELLAEGGVRQLTIEGVSARSGVAKTTIYRRWRSKDELALAVLLKMVEQIVEVPDLGDIRAELIGFVDGASRSWQDSWAASCKGSSPNLATDPSSDYWRADRRARVSGSGA